MTIEINQSIRDKALALKTRIGNTPSIRLQNLHPGSGVELWAKLEWEQLSGSVKCRAAYSIILDAIEKGELNEHKVLLDATSGNTGIAYASIAAEIGIKVSLCLPVNASEERKKILESLGAHIIYTSKFEGTDGAQEVARSLALSNPDKYFYADQYKNENNWKAHFNSTGPEILDNIPGITHFVAGLGTTGTFTGTARRIKKDKPGVQLISLQPDSALHGLEGWKHMETAVVPYIYDPSLADEQLEISTEEAYDMVRLAYEKEGLLLSPSSAANLAGAIKVMDRIREGVVVTVLPDNSDKYPAIVNKIIMG
jgi:cysteine synthase B